MPGRRIAIVGASTKFATGETIDDFWQALKEGRECVGRHARVESENRSPDGGHWVELVPQSDKEAFFDAGFFGLSPREADSLEPQHRLFLEAAWEALEDGGYARDLSGPRVGVFGGANFNSYFSLTNDDYLPKALDGMIGADKDYLATRVAHHLGLQGPAITVQTACSTSLVAVHLACQSLAARECDAALAGGVSLTTPRLSRYYYQPGGILSPDGYCRAFDAQARGTIFTEGVGVVLLMRLEDALARRHPIYAVIRGSAINNDGGGKASYMAPSIAGQERVIRDALTSARLNAADIGYVEAHGTATILGDAIELAALTRVFRSQTDKVGYCQLGSVKTNIGHTASAAGVAGLIKAALAVKHGLIPPNVNYTSPNPDLDELTSPFFVSARARAWPSQKGLRRAGISSFGVGGANAHVIIEEPPSLPRSRALRPQYALTLSAKTPTALAALAGQMRGRLVGQSRKAFADLAYTLSAGRQPLDYRTTVVADDAPGARRELLKLTRNRRQQTKTAPGARTVAFVFPGQGAQYPGMGSQLYREEPGFRSTIDECLSALKDDHGLDLSAFFTGAVEPTAAAPLRTEISQPAIFVVELALARLIQSWGVVPSYVCGHSVGDYAAACVAGVMTSKQALRLLTTRGMLMQQLPQGAMLSVALGLEALTALLSEGLEIAAVNGPRQCVVSGPTVRIAAMEHQLSALKIAAVRLRTSHAFHSAMMEPMLADFRQVVQAMAFHPPQIPIVSNLTGELVTPDEMCDPEYWTQQIRRPVQFAQGLQTLAVNGVDLIIEVGPGRQLTGLGQAAGLHRQGVSLLPAMPTDQAGVTESESLLRCVSQAWVEGVKIDWPALYGAERRQMVATPSYPFERERFRTGPSQVVSKAADLGKLKPERWLYVPSWRRMGEVEARPATGSAPWLVVGEADCAGALAQTLRAAGARVVTAIAGTRFRRVSDDAYSFNPTSAADHLRLLKALRSHDATPRQVVHLTMPEVDLRASNEQRGEPTATFKSLLLNLAAFRQVNGSRPVTFEIVTQGACEVTGREQLQPATGGLVAFSKVAPQEHPHIKCRVIDVETWLGAGGSLDRLTRTLLQGSGKMIAIRDRFAWEQTFEPVLSEPVGQSSKLRVAGTYLITGGLGHVGMILARRLAAGWKARLVLVGRRSLPPRDRWNEPLMKEPEHSHTAAMIGRILELEALGAEVLYIAGDVSRIEDVQRIRRITREVFGELNGVISASGRVDTGCAIDEIGDFSSYRHNYLPKAMGVENLLEVFGHDDLDFGQVLSSVSAILGGLAHCPYAAANISADLMVLRHRREQDGVWSTINWDRWAEGPDTAEIDRQDGRLEALAIAPNEGGDVFERLLQFDKAPQVVVSTHNLEARLDVWIRGQVVTGGAIEATHNRPRLASTFAKVEGELEKRLAEIWRSMLGIENIGRDDDFFEMGGHSLLAVQTAAEIQRLLPGRDTYPNIYNHPTIRQIAAALNDRTTLQ